MPDESEYVVPAMLNAVASVTHGNATEKKSPKEAVLALEMLAEGRMHEEIKKATGFTLAAISALKARHEITIEERRKELHRDGLQVAEMMRQLTLTRAQQLADDPEALKKTNIRDLVLPWAIGQDKALAALGEATRVEVTHKKGVSLEDAQAEIDAARARLKAQSIEVVVSPAVGPDTEEEDEGDDLPETARGKK